MHTARRLLFLTGLLALTVPAAGSLLLQADVRGEVQQKLSSALDQATDEFRRRTTIHAIEGKQDSAAQQISDIEAYIQKIMKAKSDVRRKIAADFRQEQLLQDTRAQAVLRLERLSRLELLPDDKLSRMVVASRPMDGSGAEMPPTLIIRVLSMAMRSDVLTDFSVGAPSEGRVVLAWMQRTTLVRLARIDADMTDVTTELTSLEQRHIDLLSAYADANAQEQKAQEEIAQGASRLAAIRREMAVVQRDVLRLQAELARIDARLKSKVQRELLEKGLIDPLAPGGPGVTVSHVKFMWPVHGSIAAYFHDKAYFQRFGVQHYGVDITQAQGSPVAAAAKGIVFLVRDGGEHGYTYVLIGHEDGMATLYGHLSVVSVAAGQEVAQGQAIGLSGGTPGTPGAGLLTTGPHLHFEVIQQGVNINPLSVLP